jgi:hypothetical protein
MIFKDIEQCIKQVKSVISCKIIADDTDNIQEIHIVSNMSRSPKQISRDIQSILISNFGLDIDHKKVSIAQIDEDTIENKNFRLKLKAIGYATTGTRVEVKVSLEKDDEVFDGMASGANTSYNTCRLLAKATLNAVENFCNVSDTFILEDVNPSTIAGREVMVVAVAFISADSEQLFTGSALVNRDKNEAVVKATLGAINRNIAKCYRDI